MTLQGDNEFAKQYDDLVRGIATKLARQLNLGRALDEMVAYGFQGLVEARASYDPDKQVPFHGFAQYRIRGSILVGIQRIEGLSRKTYARIVRAAEALEQAGNERAMRGPSEDYDELGAGFDAIFGKLTGSLILAQIAEEQQTPETRLMLETERLRVRRALMTLSVLQQKALVGIYFDERPLDDIAAEHGVSKSAVSHLHTRALASLREALSQAPS